MLLSPSKDEEGATHEQHLVFPASAEFLPTLPNLYRPTRHVTFCSHPDFKFCSVTPSTVAGLS